MNPIVLHAFYDELAKIAAEEEKKPMSPLKSTLLGAGIGLGGSALVGAGLGVLNRKAYLRSNLYKRHAQLTKQEAKALVGLQKLESKLEVAKKLLEEKKTVALNKIPRTEEAIRKFKAKLSKPLKVESSKRDLEAYRSYLGTRGEEQTRRLDRLKRQVGGDIRRVPERIKRLEERIEQGPGADLRTAREHMAKLKADEPKIRRRAIIEPVVENVNPYYLGPALRGIAGAGIGAGTGLTTGLLRRKKEQNAS